MRGVKFCGECGQRIRLAHKETLNKKLLQGLQAASKIVIDSNKNDIDLHKMIGDYNIYNNFQKLRYFGLAHHYVDASGKQIRGHWLITRNGWAFLRGEKKVHKWVMVLDNDIKERSQELTDVRSVYRGSDIVITTFEYFDEQGKPIGFRPRVKPERQVSML